MTLTDRRRIMALNDKRVINGWAFFDWANSSYALVISVAIFPAYFIRSTDDFISFGNIQISNSAVYAYSISLAYLIITLFLPLLSGIADYAGRRKFFLKFFTLLGSLSCISLFFFKTFYFKIIHEFIKNFWDLFFLGDISKTDLFYSSFGVIILGNKNWFCSV